MKKALILLLLSFICLGSLQAQTCSDNNFATFMVPNTSGIEEHVVPSDGGDHHFTTFFTMSCHYQSNPVAPSQFCNTTSASQAELTSVSESGATTPLFFRHFIGASAKGGLQVGVNGATASTSALAAGAVLDCIFSCAVTVGISGSSNGVGLSASFPPTPLWHKETPASGISCGPVLDPTFAQPPPPCDPCLGCSGATPTSTVTTVSSGPGGELNHPVCSPIIIDLTGNGFDLTSAANGVLFDITGTDHPIQIAWTGNANNAFLALDRNGNGVINSGAELFGNFAAQPASAHPNGFAALAVYDDPANGGNGDGVIDARDAIFS